MLCPSTDAPIDIFPFKIHLDRPSDLTCSWARLTMFMWLWRWFWSILCRERGEIWEVVSATVEWNGFLSLKKRRGQQQKCPGVAPIYLSKSEYHIHFITKGERSSNVHSEWHNHDWIPIKQIGLRLVASQAIIMIDLHLLSFHGQTICTVWLHSCS